MESAYRGKSDGWEDGNTSEDEENLKGLSHNYIISMNK